MAMSKVSRCQRYGHVKGIAMSEGFGRNSVVRGSFGPPSLLCAQIQGLGSLNSQDAVEAWLSVTIGSFKEMVSVPASYPCRVVCVLSRAAPRRLVHPRGAGDAPLRYLLSIRPQHKDGRRWSVACGCATHTRTWTSMMVEPSSTAWQSIAHKTPYHLPPHRHLCRRGHAPRGWA